MVSTFFVQFCTFSDFPVKDFINSLLLSNNRNYQNHYMRDGLCWRNNPQSFILFQKLPNVFKYRNIFNIRVVSPDEVADNWALMI